MKRSLSYIRTEDSEQIKEVITVTKERKLKDSPTDEDVGIVKGSVVAVTSVKTAAKSKIDCDTRKSKCEKKVKNYVEHPLEHIVDSIRRDISSKLEEAGFSTYKLKWGFNFDEDVENVSAPIESTSSMLSKKDPQLVVTCAPVQYIGCTLDQGVYEFTIGMRKDFTVSVEDENDDRAEEVACADQQIKNAIYCKTLSEEHLFTAEKFSCIFAHKVVQAYNVSLFENPSRILKAHVEQVILPRIKNVLSRKKFFADGDLDIEFCYRGTRKMNSSWKIVPDFEDDDVDHCVVYAFNIEHIRYRGATWSDLPDHLTYVFPHIMKIDKKELELKKKMKMELEDKKEVEVKDFLPEVTFEKYYEEILDIVKDEEDCRDIVHNAPWLPDYDQYVDKDDYVMYCCNRIAKIFEDSHCLAVKK